MRCDPEAVTEPGTILSDEEIEALERRVRSAPPPRLRLVAASLDRQIAAKRETRPLPEILLATGAMQLVHVGRVMRLERAWLSTRQRLRLVQLQMRAWWSKRQLLASARIRCRAQLRTGIEG